MPLTEVSDPPGVLPGDGVLAGRGVAVALGSAAGPQAAAIRATPATAPRDRVSHLDRMVTSRRSVRYRTGMSKYGYQVKGVSIDTSECQVSIAKREER